jgi:phosphoesterase RecJ-like protein
MDAIRETIDALQAATTCLIVTHAKPDGDAVGATLGLRRLLAAQGRTPAALSFGAMPARYAFLVGPGETLPLSDCLAAGPAAIAVLDCGDPERAPILLDPALKGVPVINIDHHPSNTGFGNVNLVDSTASSTGELICRLAARAGWPLTRDVAEPLWVAIVTDTGRFAYSNTGAETLQAAATLVGTGIDIADIDRRVYRSRPLREIQLQQRALASLMMADGGLVAAMSLAAVDFQACAAGPQDIEEVVNIAAAIEGVAVAALFYEVDGGTRTCVSLRSQPPCDVGGFARQFHGGGHARAAGLRMSGPLAPVRETVLAGIHDQWFSGKTHTG